MVSSIGADSRGFHGAFSHTRLDIRWWWVFWRASRVTVGSSQVVDKKFLSSHAGGGRADAFGSANCDYRCWRWSIVNAIFRSAVRQLVESAVIAAVRDDESRLFLRSIGVTRNDLEVTADAALCVSSDDIPEEYLVDVREQVRFSWRQCDWCAFTPQVGRFLRVLRRL